MNKDLSDSKEKNQKLYKALNAISKEDNFKDTQIYNMNQSIKEMDKEAAEYKTKIVGMEKDSRNYGRRLNEMNSIIRSILLKLEKIKDEHLSMRSELEGLREENEFLKDRHGIDLAQLTPRPNWEGLKEQYSIKDINEEDGKP